MNFSSQVNIIIKLYAKTAATYATTPNILIGKFNMLLAY